MDLPIDDKELDLLIWMSEHVSGDGSEELHNKLKLVKEARQYSGSWPAPYKKVLREKYGMII